VLSGVEWLLAQSTGDGASELNLALEIEAMATLRKGTEALSDRNLATPRGKNLLKDS
jgi:hypothetical protein